MDYSFFCRQIGTINTDALATAGRMAEAIPTDDATENFRYNPGYTTTNDMDKLSALVDFLLMNSEFPIYFQTRHLQGADLGRLEAHTTLEEHTDNNPPNGVGYTTQRLHKIHFCLTGSGCRAFHRRDKKLAVEETMMPIGTIWAFNNYVYHGIRNDGPTARRSLVLKFWDLEWVRKNKLYATLGVKDKTI